MKNINAAIVVVVVCFPVAKIAALEGSCRVKHFASTMGHDLKRLFSRLKADRILRQSGMPYQAYIDRGYFKILEDCTKVLTGKGQVWLARKYPANMSLVAA